MHVYHVIILSLAEPGPVKIIMSCEFLNSQDIVSCEAPGLFATTGNEARAIDGSLARMQELSTSPVIFSLLSFYFVALLYLYNMQPVVFGSYDPGPIFFIF